MATDRQRSVLDNYGYVNARVRAMKSVLLKRDFFEELLKAEDYYNLISLLEKTPYRPELDECVTSKSMVAGVDEALKRNLTRNFRKILHFSGGEPHDLVLLLLGRWDLHNIITILRGIHITVVSTDQIMESVVPAGELDIPLLSELAQEKTVKGFIDLLATWGSSYARALNETYAEYIENGDLSVMELALGKMYYHYVLKHVEFGSSNCKMLRDLFVEEIDAINITTILRLQNLSLKDFLLKKEKAKTVVEENKGPFEEKKGYKDKLIIVNEKIKVWLVKFKENIIKLWQKLTVEENKGGAVFGAGKKTFILNRLFKNSVYLIILDYQEFKRRLYKKDLFSQNKLKDITENLIIKLKLKFKKTNKNENDIAVKQEIIEKIKTEKMEKEITESRAREFFIPGGKVISEEKFVKLCLLLDVEKVVEELENTSFGWILKSVLQRYLEFNTLSVLERTMEELIIKKGVDCYNKGQLSAGIPLGYIWKKYNEVVNLRIIVRCKKIGMPERKIREQLVLL